MKFKYDGKSRPSNKAYDDNYNRIFKKDHDKFSKLQQEQRDLDASYRQSLANKKERQDIINTIISNDKKADLVNTIIERKRKEMNDKKK